MSNKVKGLVAVTSLMASAALADRPQTLLEMANAPIPFNPKSAVVVLIDYQEEYLSGLLPLYKVNEALVETRKLLDWARESRLPVIHVFHQGAAGGVFDPNAGGKPIASVGPVEGETVIYKTLPNSFTGTELEKTIKALGKDSIVFAGLMTHMCLESSSRAAVDHGFKSLVVASTTTTRDLPGVGDQVVRAQDLKIASLAAIQDLVSIVDADLDAVKARFRK